MKQKRQPRTARSAQRPAPNYALRRAVVFGALLLVVGLLVWGVVAAVRAVTGSGADAEAQSGGELSQSQPATQGQQPQEKETTPDGIVDKDGSVTVPECQVADLRITAENVSVSVGSAATVAYTVTNVGPTACQTAAGRITQTVTSADDTYLETAACAGRDPDATPLLLSQGGEWSSSFTWNGGIHQGCDAVDANEDGKTDIADPGTYSVNFLVNGATSGANAVVTVQ